MTYTTFRNLSHPSASLKHSDVTIYVVSLGIIFRSVFECIIKFDGLDARENWNGSHVDNSLGVKIKVATGYGKCMLNQVSHLFGFHVFSRGGKHSQSIILFFGYTRI